MLSRCNCPVFDPQLARDAEEQAHQRTWHEAFSFQLPLRVGVKRVKGKGEPVACNVFQHPCPFQVGEDDLWLPTSRALPSTSKCWGLFLLFTLCHRCASCAGSGYCASFPGGSLGTKIYPFCKPVYKGITRSLSQEPSPGWDWVLPFYFVLCSLVCSQTHTKNLLGYGN